MFDNAPPLSVSIETRPEVGRGHSPLASMFKQYELIYVVGEERDLVRLRTNYRDEEVYLYRLARFAARRAPPVPGLSRADQRAGTTSAEWYHLLSNSCTINIVRYANLAGRSGGLDIRHELNGLVDRYFYETGPREHLARLRRTAPALEHHRGFEARRATATIFRSGYARTCRRRVPEIFPAVRRTRAAARPRTRARRRDAGRRPPPRRR